VRPAVADGHDGVSKMFLGLPSGMMLVKPACPLALTVLLTAVMAAVVLRRTARLFMTVSVSVWSG